MNYLVMETHRSYAVVLDNEGRFMKVANLGYEVGQKVDRVVNTSESNVTPLRLSKPVTNMLLAVASVLIIFLGSWPIFFQSIGTIQMQINPDVELSVNRLDYVVGLEGLNPDGDALVEDVGTFGKKVDELTHELAERAVEMGFLTDGGNINLTVNGRSEDWNAAKQEQLQQQLEAEFDYRFTITITTPNAEPEPAESSSVIEIPVPSPVESVPVVEDDSDYGDSDYGVTDYDGDSLYEETDYDGESDEDEDTDYDDPTDYDVTDYDDSGFDDYDDSDYDDSDYD